MATAAIPGQVVGIPAFDTLVASMRVSVSIHALILIEGHLTTPAIRG